MDHQLNNKRTELFYELLASPADKDVLHTYNLQLLVNDFPQSGILHALLMQVSNGENLKQAATYYEPKILYKLTKDADSLPEITEGQIAEFKQKAVNAFFHEEAPQPADTVEVTADEVLLAPWEEQDSAETITDNRHAIYETEAAAEAVPVAAALPELVPNPAFEAEVYPSVTELHADPNAPVLEPVAHPIYEAGSEPEHEIDEPVYDEITSHENTEAPEAGIEITGEENIVEQLTPLKHKEPELTQPIEDDIFDEIISIDDINLAVQEYYAVHAPGENIEPETTFHDIYAEALKVESPVAEPEAPVIENTETPAIAELPAPTEAAVEPVAEAPKEETLFKDRKVDLNDEAEKLILNNIAATDFFVFDKAFGDKKRAEDIRDEEAQPASVEAAPIAPAPVIEAAATVEPEPIIESEPITAIKAIEPFTAPGSTVPAKPYITAKYHDEKMPYSFMWWLDKTRKEHSGIYQPFVEFKLDTSESIKPAEENKPAITDELQQQYYENIFHLNTVEELERVGDEVLVEFDSKKKEDAIIERFIQEVPQIKPQSGDKLDNENKAKKSSEDPEDLVTETLAQIYTDQMLYPKAIATYKKLMLKFPEKSSYFASQIQQLGKK